MQAIIIAVGKGSRPGSLTEDLPKSLLKVNGKRILDIRIADISIAMLHKYGFWDKLL